MPPRLLSRQYLPLCDGFWPGNRPDVTLQGMKPRSLIAMLCAFTLADLLSKPADRPRTFHRGSHVYDTTAFHMVRIGWECSASDGKLRTWMPIHVSPTSSVTWMNVIPISPTSRLWPGAHN